MMMRRLFLFLMLLIGLAVSADEYSYLAFQKTDGTVQTVSVESLSLTIADGVLTATNADGSKTFTLADLTSMYFSAEQSDVTSIEKIETAQQGSQVTVYSLTGMQMGRYQSVAAARTALKSGVYVVEANGKRYKMSMK